MVGNFPLPQIKDDSMNNLLARFSKKKATVNDLTVETVVLLSQAEYQKIKER
jgi:NRPS condensation-like uncharacterized protein